MTFVSEIQVRMNYGEIFWFENKYDFQALFTSQNDDISKISFDGQNIRHRFVKLTIGENMQKALLQKHKLFFPIGMNVFADIPLNANMDKDNEIKEYAEKNSLDYYDAYDCLYIENAIEEHNFLEYMMTKY